MTMIILLYNINNKHNLPVSYSILCTTSFKFNAS